ncbi:hypothetical protein ABZT51_48440 [Streptomyces sp. NPDC005373]
MVTSAASSPTTTRAYTRVATSDVLIAEGDAVVAKTTYRDWLAR